MSVASTVTNFDRKTVNVNDSPTIALAAGANLSEKAGYAVKISNDAAVLCDSQGERAFGIIVSGAASGAPVSIAIQGRVQAQAGAAVTIGELVTPQTDGQLEPATSGDYPIGIALEDAAGDGSLFYILLTHAAIVA